MATTDRIEVAAGTLFDTAGRVLIAERLPDTHMAGRWEFPGGKMSEGESPHDALVRELTEELGITVRNSRPLIHIEHSYPDRLVVLNVFRITGYDGVPEGREGQALAWVAPDDLGARDLLPADVPVVNALRLPDRYLVTPWTADVDALIRGIRAAAESGTRLIQLRSEVAHDILAHHARQLRDASGNAQLVVNGNPAVTARLARTLDAGIQVPARYLEGLSGLKIRPWPVGVSCHDAVELAEAEKAGADFAVLGPVQPTTSHPDAAPLGWDAFRRLARDANIPVYAIGGLVQADLTDAIRAGGQGIAAIRGLWPG